MPKRTDYINFDSQRAMHDKDYNAQWADPAEERWNAEMAQRRAALDMKEKEESAASSPATSAGIDQAEAYANDPLNHVKKQEEQGTGDWDNKVGQTKKKSGKVTGQFSNRKKLLSGLGIGGGAGAIIAIIMMLLPLKLEMFIQNITKHAMAVPGYAIEHRTEYLVTRAIASRMLAVGYGDTANKVVFCKSGAIVCSLYKTYTTDFIEKRFGITFKTVELNKKVEITAHRKTLGGKAKSWTVDISRINPTPGMPDVTLTKVIESNKEMKSYLKVLISKDITEGGVKGQIKRFIARKVEMRKYGVTTWRAFEKVGAKIDDIKSSMRSSIIKNVFGRFSSKLAIYMGCMSEKLWDTCQKTIDKVDPDRTVVKDLIGDSDLAADAEKATGKDMSKILMEAFSKTALGTSAKVASKAIPFVGWGLLIDMYMKLVKAVDSGAVDQIISDIVKNTYMAYTYGDGASIVTNVEKLKAGDLDMNTLSVLSSMFDGAEKSPLMAAENGISNTPMATLFGGTNVYAADGSSNNSVACPGVLGTPSTPIMNGQLVCWNQMTVQNITGVLHTGQVCVASACASIPVVSQTIPVMWGQQVVTANIWNYSLGAVADVINGLIDWLAGLAANAIPPFIKDAFAQMINGVGELVQGPVTWLLQTVFGIPNVGMDATGDQNYVALSGGIRTESNELMENGQDEDGTPSGGGGQLLTTEQVAAVYDAADAETPKPSYLASLFDPGTAGSLTQQFALLAPSDGIGLIGTLLNTPATILSGFGASASAASTVKSAVANNPFNQYVYGYPAGSAALSADPNDYTAEYCQQTAAAREASYGRVGSNPTSTYSVSDPCALEKMVVGALLADAGVKDDPNSLKDPLETPTSDSDASSGANTPRPANTTDRGGGDGWTLKNGVDYTTDEYPKCDPRTPDAGTFKSPSAGWTIRLCNFPGGISDGNGGNMINALISTNAMNMVDAAKKEGVSLGLSNGMRKSFSGGYFSMHTTGLAMDLGVPKAGSTICYALSSSGLWQGSVKGYGSASNAKAACEGYGSAEHIKAYHWLLANSNKFGLHNFGNEPWHYSTSGNGV